MKKIWALRNQKLDGQMELCSTPDPAAKLELKDSRLAAKREWEVAFVQLVSGGGGGAFEPTVEVDYGEAVVDGASELEFAALAFRSLDDEVARCPRRLD